MRKKITPAALHAIPAFLDRGLSPSEIASAIGITVGTLRVKCSQMRISLRRPKVRTDAAVKGGDVRREQKRRGNPAGKSGFYVSRAAALPRPQLLTLELPQTIMAQLQEKASSRGLAKSKLVSRLLEVIVRDDLYAAVLDADEGGEPHCGSVKRAD
jgi:hypothetical protein